jgi:hypothetical protein
MKSIFSFLFVATGFTAFSQSEITIPERTQVPMESTQDLREGKNKTGEVAPFVVSEDVKIGGVTVVAKGTSVHATVTASKNRELRVDIYDVKAVDGTVIKLNDCYIYMTAAQNLNGRGALILKGTRKSCFSLTDVKVRK